MAFDDNHLMRECVKWFTDIKLIPISHYISSDKANYVDLARFLKDGSMLCKLLNILDENSIEMHTVYLRPRNAQFLVMKNVHKFLSICHDYYGLPKNELFDPRHLFELTEFHKVLYTLSKLSKCTKALHKWPNEDVGFVTDDSLLLSGNETADSTEEIEDHINTSMWSTSHFSDDEEGIYSFIEKLPDDDVIYEELVVVKSEALRPPDMRELRLRELIDTEKNYTDALHQVIYNFYTPLKEILAEDVLIKIFDKFQEISDIHKYLQTQIGRQYCSAQHISDLFLRELDKFLAYGEYCFNVSKIQDQIDELLKSDVIRTKVKESEENMGKGGKHQFRDYFMLPVQRVLKYHILFEALLKETPQSHVEYQSILKSYEAAKDLSTFVNEYKRDRDNLQIIHYLESSITALPPDLKLEQMGRLLHDGDIKIECHPDKNKNRFVFVFDKMLLLCKTAKDEKYLYKDHVLLENCKVEDGNRGTLNSVGRRANMFLVVVSGNKKAYTIITKDDVNKQRWMKAVSEAIDNVNPLSQESHKFMFTSMDIGSRCSICHLYLYGYFYQGYECNECKIHVHKECILRSSSCQQISELPSYTPPVTDDQEFINFYTYPFWVARMTREEAESSLSLSPEGTFLLRYSDKHNQHVISLRVHGEVKHMRVHYDKQKKCYYFSDAHTFVSVIELIKFYRARSLAECFEGLHEKLRRPLYDTAIVEFPYEAKSENMLSLEVHQKVIVTSRDGESRGWWRGRIGVKNGYFPKTYVELDSNW